MNEANMGSVFGTFRTAFQELGKMVAPPEKVEQHFRAARKEFLLGVRELIDMRIERMSQTQTKGTQVPVD